MKVTGRLVPVASSVVALLLAGALAAGSLASAQTPQVPPDPRSPATSAAAGDATGAPPSAGPDDPRKVEAFFDGHITRQLEEHDIPGAAVSVVKDGEVLFAGGYGQADVAADEPVVADRTLFRIASITKLFTSTAVMQLVERGELDLDRNVNRYLDGVEIPDTYPGRPVTLRHLLTHTAGFEDRFTGTGARNAAEVERLEEYVSGQMPARVRPPGEVTAYSNYGMSLAGFVVERTSGVPFERYVRSEILLPLGMESTTAAQPPAPDLRRRLAAGYDVEGGEPVAKPFEYIDDGPAGSVSTTATDMAAFMIAHLQDGRYGGTRILGEESARQMHAQQFANDPRLAGMGFGFYRQPMNGETTIQHGGNLSQFHSNLVLLPERNVGVFVAYNSYGEGGDFAQSETVQAFMDRYYPQERPPALEPSPGDAARNAALTGSYRATRSNHTGFEKIAALFFASVRVTANEDGSITTSGGYLARDPGVTELRWVGVGPSLFRAESGEERIAFRNVGREGALYLSGDSDATLAYERVAAYETPRLHLGLAAGCLSVLGLTLLAWPVGGAASWWRGRGEPGRDRGRAGKPAADAAAGRRARVLALIACAAYLLFAAGVVLVVQNVEVLASGDSPVLYALFSLPLLGVAATLGVAAYAGLALKRRYWGTFGRLHYAVVALSALTFAALLAYYNLIGYQF